MRLLGGFCMLALLISCSVEIPDGKGHDKYKRSLTGRKASGVPMGPWPL